MNHNFAQINELELKLWYQGRRWQAAKSLHTRSKLSFAQCNVLLEQAAALRGLNRKSPSDPLAIKQKRFGNNGGWLKARARELHRRRGEQSNGLS